jgi:hypothetical protein
MEIDAAREFFARLIQDTFKPAQLGIRQGAHPNATIFLFHWRLIDQERDSPEVAVMFSSDEMERFVNSDPNLRGTMAERFTSLIKIRLAEGGYNELDQVVQPFRVHIYAGDLG